MITQFPLLKFSWEKNPKVDGFQSTAILQTMTCTPEGGQFVQILNINDNHWILVANVNCKQNEINVYDSILSSDLQAKTKEQIAALIHTNEQQYILIFHQFKFNLGQLVVGYLQLHLPKLSVQEEIHHVSGILKHLSDATCLTV